MSIQRILPSILVFGACASSAQKEAEETVLLTVENRVGAQLWYFQHAPCGANNYTDVIASDEFVADGDDVSSRNLDPGCYDLYVEDEFGCFSETDTEGNLAPGIEYTWTVREQDLTCN